MILVPINCIVKEAADFRNRSPPMTPKPQGDQCQEGNTQGSCFLLSLNFCLFLAHSFFFSTNKQKYNLAQKKKKNPQWFQCQMLPLYLKLQILCSSFIIKSTTTRVKCQNNFGFYLVVSFLFIEGEVSRVPSTLPVDSGLSPRRQARNGEILLPWRGWMGFLKWLNL